MTTTTVPQARFDMGSVIQRTFKVLGRNFVPFFVLSLVLSGIPVAIISWLQSMQMAALVANTTGATPDYASIAAIGRTTALYSLLVLLISLITSSLLQAAVVTGTISDLNGRKLTLNEMVSAAVPALLTLVIVSVLYGLGLIVGFILLIVPGIFLLLLWAVVLPAAVTERTGINGAFGRSADLTRGHRWSILGLFIVVGLALAIAAFVVGAPLGALIHSTSVVSGRLPVMTIQGVILNAVIRTFESMIAATLVACLYYELRSIKEGVAPQSLVQVFA